VVAFRSGQRDGACAEISTCHQEKRWPRDRHERVHAGQVSRLSCGAAVNEVRTLGVGGVEFGEFEDGEFEDGEFEDGEPEDGEPEDGGIEDGESEAVDGDVDGSDPWLVLPDVVPGLEGVAAGLDGGAVVGSLVGDGDCEGDEGGLDDGVGDGDVGDVDGEADGVVGVGEADGDCVGVAVGDALDVGQSVEEAPGYGRTDDGGAVGPRCGAPTPAPDDAVFVALGAEVNWMAPAVGLADGVQCAVMTPPGAVELLCVAVAPAPAGLFAPVGCPLPAGAPPPPPGWPAVGPPVSTVELTCTIACRNGGTASAMLAMKAMLASTPTGRNQPTPVGQPDLAGVAACRGGGACVIAAGSSRSPNRGRSPGRGRDSGQTQWPRQVQCLA
jgi:hypothetical protein